jgi:CheY-like chemotaxis protein
MMKIRENRYDILVLDMRLPTFDVTGQESGGRPRNFGGEEILRKMQRKKIAIPTIVLTQYTVFADDSGDILNLDDLRERLGQLGSFRSLVHLSHSDPSWEGLFLRLLEELSSECQP